MRAEKRVKPSKNKSDVALDLERAEQARGQGAWRRAITAYEHALVEAPHRADVRLRIADLYAAHGEKKLAHVAYLRAAESFAAQGFSERALGVYLAAARRAPKDAEVWKRAAAIEIARGHKGDGARMLLTSARLSLRARKDEEAAMLLRRAFSLEPFHLDTSLLLARALVRIGRRDEARSLLVRLALEKHGAALRRVQWALVRCAPSPRSLWQLVRGA